MAAIATRRAPLIVALFSALVLMTNIIMPRALARQAGAPETEPVSVELETVLTDGIEAGLADVAVLVARNGAVRCSGAAGLASAEHHVALEPTNRFRIYSITKVFIATLILQLIDEGVLSLDDTVTDWLDDPAVRRIPNVERITVGQLLQHTSGVYNYFDRLAPSGRMPTSAKGPIGRGSGRHRS